METGPVNRRSQVTAASLLVALGIIYGDIGTSPLYVIKAIVGDRAIDPVLVYGGVSCIFWTLFFQTTLKYIFLTLKADNQGEGGIFSLYALVRRHGKKLAIPTILGATTLLADGIITPPISVTSAIEGSSMVNGIGDWIKPGSVFTVGTVIVILSILFFVQRYGTQRIGSSFGPVMAVWFVMLFVFGCRQIIHHPEILSALHPRYAYELLVHYPHGFWLLGAVFLCTTGAEALYSDLGHCGVRNIRISWGFVKVSLMASYIGQASWVLHDAGKVLAGRNPFFEIVPSGLLLPSILLATAATIIASQALVSGSFTLINEAMNLNFWPRVDVRQPTESKGQVFVPSVNTLLWVGCLLMVLYFRESAHMEAAYGFSITIAMMMTTVLLGYFLRYRLHWSPFLVGATLFLFGTVELSFFVANVAKIRERWMFLFFELFIFFVMYIWYYGRKVNNRFTSFVETGKYITDLLRLSGNREVPAVATHLIYLTKANNRHEVEEKIIRSIFSRQPKRAEVYWLLHINRTSQPYTLEYDISELAEGKLFKVNIHAGFRVKLRSEAYFRKLLLQLLEDPHYHLPRKPESWTRYGVEPDYKFVLIEKFLSVENELSFREEFLLTQYFFLKRLGLSDERAFGLDKGDLMTEYVPLVVHPPRVPELHRIESNIQHL